MRPYTQLFNNGSSLYKSSRRFHYYFGPTAPCISMRNRYITSFKHQCALTNHSNISGIGNRNKMCESNIIGQ